MIHIDFAELNKKNYHLDLKFAIAHSWADKDTFTTPPGGRPDSGIMYLSNCEFEYTDERGTVLRRAVRGDIVYVPQGSEYTVRFITNNPPLRGGFSDSTGTYSSCLPNPPHDEEYGSDEGEESRHEIPKETDILLNFDLLSAQEDALLEHITLSDSYMIITPKKSQYYADTFRQLNALWQADSPPARLRAMMLQLLTDLSLELQKNAICKSNYTSIYPAIRYLQENEPNGVTVAFLADICHLSPSCFRRLFKQYAGMPPSDYINSMIIKKAKMLIESGIMTVSETAYSLGFTDVSYFCRFYKRMTGSTPTEHRRSGSRA